MTIDQWINAGILVTAIITVMLPFHLQNVAARRRDRELLSKVWRRLKKHDRKVTRMGARVARLETHHVHQGHAATAQGD